jgi:hypothetical protein
MLKLLKPKVSFPAMIVYTSNCLYTVLVKDEFKLLAKICGIARNLYDEESTARILQTDYSGIKPKILLDWAIQHKVAGLVYDALPRFNQSFAVTCRALLKPTIIAERLVRASLLREWTELAKLFDAEGIAWLGLKGPSAALQLYGDPSARGYTDLDFLVDLPDLRRMLVLMKERYYEPEEENPNLYVQQDERFFSYMHHIGFKKKNQPIEVELHNKLSSIHEDFDIATLPELLNNAVPLEWDGYTHKTLNKVDHVLFQAAHGTGHMWCLLHWLLDMAHILHHESEAFLDDLAKRSIELSLDKMLAAGIAVSQIVYPVSLHGAIADLYAKHRRHISGAKAFAYVRLSHGGKDSLSAISTLRRKLSFIPAVSPGYRAALAELLKTFKVSQRDLEKLRLDSSLLVVYILARPVLIIIRKTESMLRRILKARV